MTHFNDLNEIPTYKPNFYYIHEIERAQRQLVNHNRWIDYFQEKISIMKKILKKRGVDLDGRTANSIKTAQR